MPVDIAWEGIQTSRLIERHMKAAGNTMLTLIGAESHRLSLLLCDDDTMRRLNHRFRNRDCVTDVLSFPTNIASQNIGRAHTFNDLGDIAISLPTARRQAERFGNDFGNELCFLLSHGLLHLIGLDHPDQNSLRRMHARSDVLMRAAQIRIRPKK